ncbi:uncharacterized protein BDZ83DRAFT_749608 [Colletotrichum acutatum]|uniref:Uncharacterized protein n=1 Tax=Glomerella acutata TaxID=27357 RepID=A0AAD8UQW9_GLOAC|nr:uncharacterized protein BDZ83DRAFT_749608 [Colletotrichum acutatum]KAK1727803.1 hypothetical protein BDZ83DRAFT_749608 [Colletotrichum acutatum]
MPGKSHATPLNQPIAVPSVAAVGNLVGSSIKFPRTRHDGESVDYHTGDPFIGGWFNRSTET